VPDGARRVTRSPVSTWNCVRAPQQLDTAGSLAAVITALHVARTVRCGTLRYCSATCEPKEHQPASTEVLLLVPEQRFGPALIRRISVGAPPAATSPCPRSSLWTGVCTPTAQPVIARGTHARHGTAPCHARLTYFPSIHDPPTRWRRRPHTPPPLLPHSGQRVAVRAHAVTFHPRSWVSFSFECHRRRRPTTPPWSLEPASMPACERDE